MALDPGGSSDSSHVLFPMIESISSFTASLQKADSLEAIASFNDLGSVSMWNEYEVSFRILLSWFPSTKNNKQSGEIKSSPSPFSFLALVLLQGSFSGVWTANSPLSINLSAVSSLSVLPEPPCSGVIIESLENLFSKNSTSLDSDMMVDSKSNNL